MRTPWVITQRLNKASQKGIVVIKVFDGYEALPSRKCLETFPELLCVTSHMKNNTICPTARSGEIFDIAASEEHLGLKSSGWIGWSAPHVVAETIALIKAIRPDLSPTEIKRILRETAIPSNEIPNGGILDADAALKRAESFNR